MVSRGNEGIDVVFVHEKGISQVAESIHIPQRRRERE
jgi:hypothetical protein